MKTNLPEDYYLSEASHVDFNPLPMDADLQVEESQHLHFNNAEESQNLHITMDSVHGGGLGHSGEEEGLEVYSNNSSAGLSKTQNVLNDFHAMFEHTPVWLRAEQAGMGPISPWRETCDVPFSQRPPPASSGAKHLLPEFATSHTTSLSPPPRNDHPSPSQQPLYVVYHQSTP